MLKPQHSVVRVADDNYIARRFLPPPLVYPEVEYIMQVEIGEGWRNHRPLRSPLLCLVPPSLLHHARLQPFLDQADDSPVSYSVLDEFDHPVKWPWLTWASSSVWKSHVWRATMPTGIACWSCVASPILSSETMMVSITRRFLTIA